MDGLRPYPEYRESGVAWLGRVPAHWEVRRTGRLFSQRTETGYGELPILEVSLRTGVRVRELTETGRKQVMEDRDSYKRAAAGDIAYNMMRMWQGASGFVPCDGLVSPAYVVARPHAEASAPYYAHLFRMPDYLREVDTYSRGIVADRNRLYWEAFKQIALPWPPRAEQDAIVRYLDAADRRIRRYVRAKQRLIALLEEQKRLVVHRAVTRGLDPDVPLKPSGVDWLGDVPAHWVIARLKDTCHFAYGDPLPAELRGEGIVPVFGSNGRVGFHSSPNTEAPCIVIGRKGSFGKINYSPTAVFAIDTAFYVDDRFTSADVRWLSHLLVSLRLDEFSKDAAVPGLDRVDAYSRQVAYPVDRLEQAAIAAHIEQATGELSRAINRIQREIALMREYRTRLLADVVTGKLDVRATAAWLSNEADEQDASSIDDTVALDEGAADDAPDFEPAEA